MNPQATAGRIVHYRAAESMISRAAVVNVDTAEDGLAELTIFTRLGPMVYTSVKYSEEPASGRWSWMPYQKEKAQTLDGNVSESAEPRPDPSVADFTVRRHLDALTKRLESLEQRTTAVSEAKVAEPRLGEGRTPGFHPDDRASDSETAGEGRP